MKNKCHTGEKTLQAISPFLSIFSTAIHQNVALCGNGLRAISPFPTEFLEDLFCKHVKTQDCLGKG